MTRACLFLAMLVTVLSLPRPARADGVGPPPALEEVGVDDHVGDRIPLDTELVDTAGERRRLGDYFEDGKPVILVLAYSRCAMLCNLVLRGLAKAVPEMNERPGEDYELVTVSIDPKETPHTASRHQATIAEAAGVSTDRWPFLSGDEEAIERLADALGFRYARDPRSGQIAHPSVVFVLTEDGTLAQYLQGVRYTPDQVDGALAAARAGTVTENTGALASVLSCFRFDPTRRKYGTVIAGAVTGLGVVLVLVVGAGVAWLVRRERRTRREEGA